jgi:ATP-dependent helicase IRC3
VLRTALRYASTLTNPSSSPGTSPQSGIKLRKYQEECIQAVLSYLVQGEKRLGISLATGSGKTVRTRRRTRILAETALIATQVIFTRLIDRITPPTNIATQTLILAHRRELVEQAARHCRLAYPEKTIDVELGINHASGNADITVASIQSITSGERIEKFDPKLFKLVLVDEAHHIVAPKYLEVLNHFGLRPQKPESPALVGVSATFSRFDGLKLGAAIDHIVYHKDYVDMIGEKWLSNVLFTSVKSSANLSRVKSGVNGDFLSSSLSQAVNTDETNELTVRAWFARAAERKSTLVFCVDLNHVFGLTAMFRKHGIESNFVTGDTPKKKRSDVLDSFKNGEFPVLLNCGVFTEGTDIPNIDCVLLARPTKSRNLLVQMIGRGMRLHPGKDNCHIIDLVSSLDTGVVTTPTLFGLDPDELIDEASVDDLEDRKERKAREAAVKNGIESIPENSPGSHVSRSAKYLTFTDYDTVSDLLEDTIGERHIRGLSPNAWVHADEERYVLTSNTGDYLQIRREGDAWNVYLTAKLPPGTKSASPYMRPRKIAHSASSIPRKQGDPPKTFEHAIRAADKYAAEKFPFKLINTTSSWRRRPATDGQVEFLNKFRDKDNQLTSATLTKGRASDMITKLKFGAQGRFNKHVAKRKKQGKVQEKLNKIQELRERETVRVGQLSAA